MSKRILAAFLVTLFIVATFATVAEVQAHFTLGVQGSAGPTNNGTPFYPSHDTSLTNHVAGSLAYVTPGLGYLPWQKQSSNYYSPDAAIITDTTGGLTFYINVTWGAANIGKELWNITEEAGDHGYWLIIAIPPEFTPVGNWTAGETTGVSTSITNDYAVIKTGQFATDHDLAPGWWYVKVSAETKPSHADQGYLYPPGQDPYPDRQARTGDFAGCYSVSTGSLKAPSIAGKYFFKIFLDQSTSTKWTKCIPPENWPVLLVKGELDPGYIQGQVLYGGSYAFGAYYGEAINKSGRVVAEGEAIDPVTNAPTGRPVSAVGYFNASAKGYYEIEGLAPGIYKLTAEAAGFPPTTLATEITVKRGQSIHGINIYVFPGAKIQLKVSSKCPTGALEWPSYAVNYTAWKGTAAATNMTLLFPVKQVKWALLDEEGTTVVPTFNVGPYITAVTNVSFTMLIGGKETATSYIGTEILWDGHVPDWGAHWISGLAAGVYYPKVYVFGYVQLSDYPVVVPSSEYTGSIYREMDLFKGGTATATVHFHNQELPSAEAPIAVDSVLTLEAYGSDGVLRAWNTTTVKAGSKNAALDLVGNKDVPYGMPADTYDVKVYMKGYAQQEFPKYTIQLCTHGAFSFHLVKGGNVTVTVYSRDWQSPAQRLFWLYPPAHLRVYVYNSEDELIGYVKGNQVAGKDTVTFAYWGEAGKLDHSAVGSGLPTDIYKIKAYTVGYVQKVIPEVWVQKASSTGDIPLYLYAGAKITCTVNFKMEQLFAPLSPSSWSYYFRINVFDEEGNLAAANITSVPQATTPSQPSGVQTWTFEVVGFGGATTPGKIGDPLSAGYWPDTTGWAAPEPVETAWVPADRFGYREPSGLVTHLDWGIPEGTYTVTVLDETNGYLQTATVAATVSWMGTALLYFDMHKQASISGTVYERNWMGDFRKASWYTVEVSGSPAVTTQTKDGDWSVDIPAGTYTVTVHLKAPDVSPAVVEQSRTVVVTWGADSSGQNFYLEEGGVPIPEFPAAGVLMLISALAASLYLLRWRKQAIIPMP